MKRKRKGKREEVMWNGKAIRERKGEIRERSREKRGGGRAGQEKRQNVCS